MAGLSKNGTAPLNKIKWLKGLLDEDGDSSDTTLQRKKQRPVKFSNADKKLKKRTVHKARSIARDDAVPDGQKEQQAINNKKHRQEKHGTDREDILGAHSTHQRGDSVVRHQSLHRESQGKHHLGKTHMAPLSGTKNGVREKRSRMYLEEKPGKMSQRKRPHADLEIKGMVIEKEKAVGQQLKGSIDPAKARTAALRQRRMRKLQARRKATGEHERLAAVKLKRHELSEASRLKRNQREQMRKAQKVPATAGTVEEIRDEGHVRPRSASLSTEEAKERKRTLERQRRAAKKQLSGLKSTSVSALNRLRAASSEKERQRRKEDVFHALGGPESKAGLRQKRQRLGFVKEAVGSAAGSGITLVKSPNKMSESRGADKKHSEDATISEISHEHDARSSSDINTVDGPESQEQPTQNHDDTTIREETKEEGQVDPPAFLRSVTADVKPQDKNEKTISDEINEMVLDMAPIPRKSIKDATSAASFVIPKRSAINTDGLVEARGLVRAISHNDHTPLGAHIPVSVKPEPSPKSSPRLSSRDPIRSQRKRTKTPVPMKKSVLSTHDKTLMRLARKRNSIFFAAGELAAQSTRVGNKVSPAHMTGYEVFDAGGKALPDLIPRLSCAAKREMIANKDSFAASFFGVSLAAPKAQGNNGQSVNECADDESRMMNCYEELCFQRPEDREFYQRRMYGTAFVPQHLRGRATLIVRCARFERKSTGIRFNQDRDREEFAASLSKRYTFKKSVPRCEIRRENWQKLMRNQPSVVYLHYNNIEDAERASHVFRDDAGNSLELKREHKSCVGDGRSFSPANGNRYRTPRRSCSSERSPSKPSPQSQGGGVRNTPHWQRERQEATNRYSRYDRPPSAQRKGRDDRYNLPASEYRLRSRSRSRSRPKRFSGQQHDSVGKGNGDGTGNVAAAVGTTSSENPTDGLTPGAHEGAKGTSNTEPQGSNGITKGDKDGNAETDMDALPMAPPSHTADPREHDLESGEEEQEEGEIESSSVPVPEGTDRVNDRDGWRCSRSPHRSWERRNDVQSHQRQEDYRGGPYEQYYSRGPNRRRSRSRSRPRLHVEDFATWEGGGRGDSWDAKERRYEDYDNDEYGRRMYTGEIGRYSGRDYCGGGYNDHTDDAYLRPY
ncbi:hypothetical protein PC120_g14002 [Phytophthora cactorum]|nr:hypothetical protein PC120_g14002 [Phytophthora cactorum]